MSETTVIKDEPAALDTMVANYVALRDKVADIKKAHSEQLAPYADMMGSIEALLLDALVQNNAESMRTGKGTFYKTTHASVKVKDWSETLAFIQESERWDLLEARVSKTAAQQVVEETKLPIPGVEIERMVKVNVRRPD